MSSSRSTLWLGSVVGACSAALGLLVAFYADLAPGAAIALTAIGLSSVGAIGRTITAP
ncbi:MAG: hypothetical protein ACRDZ4_17395 [Egibacteraceae bacterium]